MRRHEYVAADYHYTGSCLETTTARGSRDPAPRGSGTRGLPLAHPPARKTTKVPLPVNGRGTAERTHPFCFGAAEERAAIVRVPARRVPDYKCARTPPGARSRASAPRRSCVRERATRFE